MNWSMDEALANMILVGAPYGGPMALVRDRKQFLQNKITSKPVITIYNCAGNVISKILVRQFLKKIKLFVILSKTYFKLLVRS